MWSLIIYWTTSAVNTSAWKKDNFFVVGWRKIRMSKWRPGKIISFSHLYNFSLSRRAKSLTRTISWNASNPTILNLIPRTNSCFLFGALELLNRFHSISDVGTLFLANDKGSGCPRGLFPVQKPALAMHHTLSTDVPFGILSQWAEARGGQAIVTLSSQSVQDAGFLFPSQKSRFPFTETMLQSQFILHPMGDIFTLFQMVRLQQETADLRALIACLNACQWDPLVFDELFPTFLLHLAKEQSLGLVADAVGMVCTVLLGSITHFRVAPTP